MWLELEILTLYGNVKWGYCGDKFLLFLPTATGEPGRRWKPTQHRTPTSQRSSTKAPPLSREEHHPLCNAPLLLREELHPLCWRISCGLPLLVPEHSSPSLPMLKLRRRLTSSVVLHQFLSLRTLSTGGGKIRWCIPCFPSWASNTSVVQPPVSLHQESSLLQGILWLPNRAHSLQSRACYTIICIFHEYPPVINWN